NSPPFKRHSVGRTYPWQVAPQQSLLPFRFNNTKFKSVNYIYNLSKFPATFTTSNGSPPHQSRKSWNRDIPRSFLYSLYRVSGFLNSIISLIKGGIMYLGMNTACTAVFPKSPLLYSFLTLSQYFDFGP